jgi:hypothetical protein
MASSSTAGSSEAESGATTTGSSEASTSATTGTTSSGDGDGDGDAESSEASTGSSGDGDASSSGDGDSDSSAGDGDGDSPVCGDGVAEVSQGEQCDGDDLGLGSCEALGLGGGSLSCTPECVFDTSLCDGSTSSSTGNTDGGTEGGDCGMLFDPCDTDADCCWDWCMFGQCQV